MMAKSQGDMNYQMWLVGDSNPTNWQTKLQQPLDSRHPARHNIWTPILLEIQDHVFAADRLHLDQAKFYVRNAIQNSKQKPDAANPVWSEYLQQAVEAFRDDICKCNPKIIFTFGAFSYEFTRRSSHLGEPMPYNTWNTRTLGEAFRKAINTFQPDATNVIPLLHVSISRGKFIESHNNFCDSQGQNYFVYTGRETAAKLLDFRNKLDIWVDAKAVDSLGESAGERT